MEVPHRVSRKNSLRRRIVWRRPRTHDFLLATTVFDDSDLTAAVGSDYELLVTYAPKRALSGGLSGTPDHCLHYVIVPRGTLEHYYSLRDDLHMATPAPEKLFGAFVYQGRIGVGRNQNPTFE